VKGESVRDQRVHALSVKSGRLLETTVENVHFDKNLGMAEITRESAEDFVKRHHPDTFEEFARTNATAEYPVFLDFEDILSGAVVAAGQGQAWPGHRRGTHAADVGRNGAVQHREGDCQRPTRGR